MTDGTSCRTPAKSRRQCSSVGLMECCQCNDRAAIQEAAFQIEYNIGLLQAFSRDHQLET